MSGFSIGKTFWTFPSLVIFSMGNPSSVHFLDRSSPPMIKAASDFVWNATADSDLSLFKLKESGCQFCPSYFSHDFRVSSWMIKRCKFLVQTFIHISSSNSILLGTYDNFLPLLILFTLLLKIHREKLFV